MEKSQFTQVLHTDGSDDNAKPRNFYIWGYQPHFATTLRVTAESLFKLMDVRIKSDVFLVAINVGPKNEFPPAVVEPDDHEFKADDFFSVLSLTTATLKTTPGTNYAYQAGSKTGAAWAEREERREYYSRIGSVVQQTIEGLLQFDKPRVFVSTHREAGPFVVFVVLLIDSFSYHSHARLQRTTRDRYSVVVSLLDAAGKAFVKGGWEALPRSFDGEACAEMDHAEVILRKAGESFMYTPFGACNQFHGLHGGFEACNEISTLTYETSVGRGRLLLAPRNHPNITETVSFSDPTPLRKYRAVRKQLQLSRGDEALVCDSELITGLGQVVGNYDASAEDLFMVEFVGHSKWELSHAGTTLMRVEHGLPKLPMGRVRVAQFKDTLERIFPTIDSNANRLLCQIVASAGDLDHGTILVLAEDAEAEAERFGAQATRIKPLPLSLDLVSRASLIDGAMLVSLDGSCHAIGVILDGPVNEKGTPDRGARLNSAIRYVYGTARKRIALVISDDGMINLIPEYRPCISKSEIDRRLRDLKDVVEPESVDQRQLNKTMIWFTQHRFYFSAEACRQINDALQVAKPKSDRSSAWCIYGEFAPHREMDESYLK